MIDLQEPASQDMAWRARAAGVKHLYIHIPFCHRRCAYCDFNTYANMDDRMDAYVDSLCKEIRDWGLEIGDPPLQSPISNLQSLTRAALRPTIFLGGGTPSMLPLPLIERVLGAAEAIVPLEQAEVTVEANPGTVLGRDYLRELRRLGVNRLSMGVQSLHDPTLRVLGRIHTAAEARASYVDARRAGFDNINLDFIFGLPGQTVEQWDATLREIATWDTDHFSLYSLILEERTPLYAQVIGGRLSVPDEDATGEMYERAIDWLGSAGYVQYEISNWARNENKAQSTKDKEQSDESVLCSFVCVPPQPSLLAQCRLPGLRGRRAWPHLPAALLRCARNRRVYRASSRRPFADRRADHVEPVRSGGRDHVYGAATECRSQLCAF